MNSEEIIEKLKQLIRPPEDTEDFYFNDGVISSIKVIEKLNRNDPKAN